MKQALDVGNKHLGQVKAILKKFLPQSEVRVFGSRVKGAAKPYSDLDLALISHTPISSRTMALMKEAFSESDLPFKVDLVDWNLISEEFRKLIEAEGIPLSTSSLREE